MTCPVGTNVDQAARWLRAGKLVAFATETVYGLGANALDVNAVARVFATKNRPRFDPLIVHVAERAWLPRLAAEWPSRAEQLRQRFWPGPLTLVVPKTDLVPDLVTSGLPSVALRMPSHPLAIELLQKADVPVAAPSANPFGQLSPTTAAHVVERLGEQIDYVLDGGPCTVGIESTVIQLDGDRAVLLRPGGVPIEEIETTIGTVEISARTVTHPEEAAPSPGMLLKHYAPRTPLEVIEHLPSNDRQNIGLLTLAPVPRSEGFGAVEILSATGDLVEAAANFFTALRRLDASGVCRIVARPFPNEGLGRALNDRLQRAATN
jgi:L-threonylcarbamoyladenylate synthase